MSLSVKALTIAGGILWGGAVCLSGIANAVWPSYGVGFLQMVASIYPGFRPTGSVGSILSGTSYAILDGAVCGLLFGWLYNRCASTLGVDASRRITL